MSVALPEHAETSAGVARRRSPIRILLIGGTTLFRAGLRALVGQTGDIEIAGAGRTLAEGLEHANEFPGDILLLDSLHSRESVLETLEQIRQASADARVLVVTIRSEPDVLQRMVIAGARGVIFTDEPADQLLTAVHKVHQGELWIDRATAARIITDITDGRHREKANPEQAKIASLTRREMEVIILIAAGFNNKATAARMKISDSTVRHHLTSIFAKLDVPDRLALVIFAFRHGLALST
jgi:DNA-binding NarL/FixJ family response regulator